MNSSVKWLIRLVMLGVGLGVYLWLGKKGVTIYGALEASKEDFWPRAIMGYGLTLLGVLFGAAYRELIRLRAGGESKVSPRAFLKQLLESFELWLGLFGSPVVFTLVLNSTDGVNHAGLATIALQNGFFCTMLVAEMRPPGAKPTTASPASGV